MRRLAFLVSLALLLAACKGSRAKEVVGTWKTSEGATSELSEGGTMTKTIGRLVEKGTWKVEGDDVTETVATMNNVTPAELKARMQRRFPNPPPKIKALIDDIDKPNVYKLGADGKAMTTDAALDKNSGDPVTYRKQ